jgi:DivIVA domain-containing protein
MIQIPGFRTVLRGYDPTEVDRAIGDLIKARDQARSEAADNAIARSTLETELAQLEEQAAGYRTRLEKLETSANETPSAGEIGARIGRMLALAEDESNEVRTQATAEAERLLSSARAEAEQLTGNAERYARDVVSKADTEAARILEAARRQSDEIVDYADREAVSRREEAESIYEAHRARAAAAADDFERALAERQQRADADFAERTRANEHAIATLAERQAGLQAEAESVAERARAEADAILRAAREEADQQMAAAHAGAARVRMDSERELQAIQARRDAINAQLATVRQLLANLDLGRPAGGDARTRVEESDDDPKPETSVPLAEDVADETAGDEHAESGKDGTQAEADAAADTESMARSGRR